ncbi:hypothetical protein B0H11DRAFT_1904138 [Mycena galericulata]|nr:hypothetical protein B0H11DRAFT_1904138 [Mycena galericulata]
MPSLLLYGLKFGGLRISPCRSLRDDASGALHRRWDIPKCALSTSPENLGVGKSGNQSGINTGGTLRLEVSDFQFECCWQPHASKVRALLRSSDHQGRRGRRFEFEAAPVPPMRIQGVGRVGRVGCATGASPSRAAPQRQSSRARHVRPPTAPSREWAVLRLMVNYVIWPPITPAIVPNPRIFQLPNALDLSYSRPYPDSPLDAPSVGTATDRIAKGFCKAFNGAASIIDTTPGHLKLYGCLGKDPEASFNLM